MFAANRSMVLSQREKFEGNNDKIYYFMNNIFITDTLDTIKADVLGRNGINTIITISSSTKSMFINDTDPEIVKYKNGSYLKEYEKNSFIREGALNTDSFTIHCLKYSLDTFTSSDTLHLSTIIYKLLKDNRYVSSHYKYLIVFPSFESILPVLIKYLYILIDKEGKFEGTKIVLNYVPFALKPFCTRDNIDQYTTFITNIKSNQT